MKQILAIVLLILLSGCAATYVPPAPNYQLTPDARIGIIITTSDTPKHTHFGTTIFNNFVTDYDYNWDIKNEIFNIFQSRLANSAYQLVDLSDSALVAGQNLNFTKVENKQWVAISEQESLRQQLLAEGFQVIIQIKEQPTLALMQCSNMGCTNFNSQGVGLFTRSFFGIDNYYASASFYYSVEVLDPGFRLSALKPFDELNKYQSKNILISKFDSPADFKALTEAELAPVKAGILRYVEQLAATTIEQLQVNGTTN